jgi:hypothetical protein
MLVADRVAAKPFLRTVIPLRRSKSRLLLVGHATARLDARFDGNCRDSASTGSI